MKPEIRAMLPKMHEAYEAGSYDQHDLVIPVQQVNYWLEKFTEGAVVCVNKGETWMEIGRKPIDKRVPLSELLNQLRSQTLWSDQCRALATRAESNGVDVSR